MKIMFLMTHLALCFADSSMSYLSVAFCRRLGFLQSITVTFTQDLSNQNCIKYYRSIYKQIPNPRILYGCQKANNIKIQLSPSMHAVWEIIRQTIFLFLGVHAVSTFFMWNVKLFLSVYYYTAVTFLWSESLNQIIVFHKIRTCWIKLCGHIFTLFV